MGNMGNMSELGALGQRPFALARMSQYNTPPKNGIRNHIVEEVAPRSFTIRIHGKRQLLRRNQRQIRKLHSTASTKQHQQHQQQPQLPQEQTQQVIQISFTEMVV